tara:strand:+ start:5995 stop:6108 length:114 start_codon:yes stop_codon:yes gene_type:complete
MTLVLLHIAAIAIIFYAGMVTGKYFEKSSKRLTNFVR